MSDDCNSTEINNPHDTGYKLILSAKKVFLELLQSFVEAGWTKQIDSNELIKVDKSYILPDFKKREADLVYQAKIKDQKVIFYVLIELQSTVDFQMPYRLLLYQVEIWRDILKSTTPKEAGKKEFQLPVIVPVVLYNGSNNWTTPLEYKKILAGHDLFGEHILNFKYILIDINRYQKQDLLKTANLISTVFLLDQKINAEELIKRLLEISKVIKKLDETHVRLFQTWVEKIPAEVKDLPIEIQQQITRIIKESNPEEGEQMISNIAQTIQKGLEEREFKGRKIGEQRGEFKKAVEIARNLLAKNMDIEEISQVTGLPKKEILKLM